jgi:signal transduction histidine kinase
MDLAMASSTTFPIPMSSADPAIEQSLTRAFVCFTQAAQSLENSYRHLELELARLRRELEQKNAQLAQSLEENRKMRDFLRQVVEELPCGVLVAESSGCFSLVNATAMRMLCRSEEAPSQLADLPYHLRVLLDRAREHAGVCELQIGGESEGSRFIAIRHFAISQGGRESVFLLEDVSEQRQAQKEHERAERQQAQTDLAAILAHEIRNPLGSMEVFAGLLAECGLGEEPRSWVEHVQAGLRTLAATVNNVLHFHNSPPSQLQRVDAGQILGWVCEFLRPLAKQAGVRLVLENRLGGVLVRADRHRLEQVFLNLAMNALRFMPRDGVLEIMGCVHDDPSKPIEIIVSDSGPGIQPSEMQRIFEAGYTTRQGSPGLGLTVCKTILEQHGGMIGARNRAEGGASFVVRLPAGERG